MKKRTDLQLIGIQYEQILWLAQYTNKLEKHVNSKVFKIKLNDIQHIQLK